MNGVRPISARLLSDTMVVRVPVGDGGFSEERAIRRVRFCRVQSVSGDDHRSADAGAGCVFVDAVASPGAFEVPAGSRVGIDGHSYVVAACRRCETVSGRIHHWELTIR